MMMINIQPNHFDFYGFGQPGQGSPIPPTALDIGANDANLQAFGWNAWHNLENPPTEAQQLAEDDEIAPQLISIPRDRVPEVINDENLLSRV